MNENNYRKSRYRRHLKKITESESETECEVQEKKFQPKHPLIPAKNNILSTEKNFLKENQVMEKEQFEPKQQLISAKNTVISKEKNSLNEKKVTAGTSKSTMEPENLQMPIGKNIILV